MRIGGLTIMLSVDVRCANEIQDIKQNKLREFFLKNTPAALFLKKSIT
jgi:hypothetical protein